jgi:hypothetical protein
MSMRKMLAAAALLLPAMPAMANWGATRWGMTPEQVIAAVPGAAATAAGNGTDVRGMHQLASAPYRDGDIETDASFLFDPKDNKLVFVGLTPRDHGQCGAYEKRLVARYGTGKASGQELGGLKLGKIEWVERGSRDRLMFSWFRRPDGSYAICKFIAEKP